MSMVSEQVNRLKVEAEWLEKDQEKRLASILLQAADTIESLSAKLQAANEELERWHTDHINEKIKNPFAWTSTLICHNCDHKDEYIEELEAEVEELKAANMERSAEDSSGWIIASERMPEEERCIDPETGYYVRSDNVLCSAYNEYEMRDEIWIDYTIDGEWQTHEWYEGEKLAWMPLPAQYREVNEP